MPNFSLQDKTVIVTGGAGGLGRPMCAIFAAASANVIVASRSRDKIEADAAALREQGYRAEAIEVDVTDEQQVNNLIEQTVAAFGAVDVGALLLERLDHSGVAVEARGEDGRPALRMGRVGIGALLEEVLCHLGLLRCAGGCNQSRILPRILELE